MTLGNSRWLRAAVALPVAAGLTLIAPTAAHADENWWPAVYSSCTGGKYVKITFDIRNDVVRVGTGARAEDAGTRLNRTLPPGNGQPVYTDRRSAWWMVWASPGDVVGYRVSCVSYT